MRLRTVILFALAVVGVVAVRQALADKGGYYDPKEFAQ